jgi:hypothetical protein
MKAIMPIPPHYITQRKLLLFYILSFKFHNHKVIELLLMFVFLIWF